MAAAGDMNVTFQGIPPETRAERRERIAVQILVALCSNPNSDWTMDGACVAAARYASLLLDELDKQDANDKRKGGE